MSEQSQNPPEWIGALAGAIAGLGSRHLLDLARLLNLARSTPPSSGQLQRTLSLSTASAAQLARGLDQIINSPGVSVRDVQTALMTLASTRTTGIAQTDTVGNRLHGTDQAWRSTADDLRDGTGDGRRGADTGMKTTRVTLNTRKLKPWLPMCYAAGTRARNP